MIDPNKKAAFERLCEAEDVTSSQKIRQRIEKKLG